MNETKDKNFTVRLSAAEYEHLQKEAKRLHLSVGAYIRYKAIVEPIEKKEVKM